MSLNICFYAIPWIYRFNFWFIAPAYLVQWCVSKDEISLLFLFLVSDFSPLLRKSQDVLFFPIFPSLSIPKYKRHTNVCTHRRCKAGKMNKKWNTYEDEHIFSLKPKQKNFIHLFACQSEIHKCVWKQHTRAHTQTLSPYLDKELENLHAHQIPKLTQMNEFLCLVK